MSASSTTSILSNCVCVKFRELRQQRRVVYATIFVEFVFATFDKSCTQPFLLIRVYAATFLSIRVYAATFLSIRVYVTSIISILSIRVCELQFCRFVSTSRQQHPFCRFVFKNLNTHLKTFFCVTTQVDFGKFLRLFVRPKLGLISTTCNTFLNNCFAHKNLHIGAAEQFKKFRF